MIFYKEFSNMFNMFLQPIDTYCKLSHDFSPLTPRTSGSKAAGVESFYQIIYQHWEAPLKELHLARLASAKSKGSGDLSDGLVVIPDDDDNLESLESKSLEQASLWNKQWWVWFSWKEGEGFNAGVAKTLRHEHRLCTQSPWSSTSACNTWDFEFWVWRQDGYDPVTRMIHSNPILEIDDPDFEKLAWFFLKRMML